MEQDKVFIGYAREDYKIAKRLYDDLKKAGITPWLDTENLIPGQNWKLTVGKAIKDSRFFLALFSINSVRKRSYMQAEFKMALEIHNNFLEDDIYIIPARLTECEIPQKFAHLHYVNLFPSYKKGLEKILQVFPNLQSVSEESLKASESIKGMKSFLNIWIESLYPSKSFMNLAVVR